MEKVCSESKREIVLSLSLFGTWNEDDFSLGRRRLNGIHCPPLRRATATLAHA